jgi:hypothetical protein
MKYDLQYVPIVNSAAATISSCFANRSRMITVDHLTVSSIDPGDWDLVFVLCAETTYKIRKELDRLGNKLVLIHTSNEPGLEKYCGFFFPYWLFCVDEVNRSRSCDTNSYTPTYTYNALLGRAKDTRTLLLKKLEERNLLASGIVGYSPGNYYSTTTTLDSAPYYSNIWQYEEPEIQQLYTNDLNYTVKFDSTTRLINGYFSSCVVPYKIFGDTFLTVVAETDTVGAHSFPTEKTWKPLYAGHPAVFYATPNHERFLESLGFEMYSVTDGDPERVASVVADAADHDYFNYNNWLDITRHNKQLCNVDLWRKRLYDWLHENFVN